MSRQKERKEEINVDIGEYGEGWNEYLISSSSIPEDDESGIVAKKVVGNRKKSICHFY